MTVKLKYSGIFRVTYQICYSSTMFTVKNSAQIILQCQTLYHYHEILLCNLVPRIHFILFEGSDTVVKWWKYFRPNTSIEIDGISSCILNYKYMHDKWLNLFEHISLYNDQEGADYDVLVIIIIVFLSPLLS